MFETLRKYGSVFMLLLASTLLLCLVAEEICDVQHWVKQDAHSSCLSYFAEDFDFDEEDDDEVIVKSSKEFDSRVAVPMLETNNPKAVEKKSPEALLRGQVRHYSPRNGLACSHNYTFLSTTKRGVDLLHATFFVHIIIFITEERDPTKRGSRSIFQTKT